MTVQAIYSYSLLLLNQLFLSVVVYCLQVQHYRKSDAPNNREQLGLSVFATRLQVSINFDKTGIFITMLCSTKQ